MFKHDALRDARARRRLTQDEVADQMAALGVPCSKWRVSEWERGSAVPNVVACAALLRVLRVPLSTVVVFEEEA